MGLIGFVYKVFEMGGILPNRFCLFKWVQLLSQVVMNIGVLELFTEDSKKLGPVTL